MSRNLGVKISLAALILVQLVLVFCLQAKTINTDDAVFSYTLANSPNDYCFIDAAYEVFPNSNGWIDAHILREHYVVEAYDRFNYGAVYFHQRWDVHPPLYYFLVHTISSLFPGRYSNLFALVINLFALFFVDFILIKLFGRLYQNASYAAVPIMALLLMNVMRFLFTWARMYMLLFLFCLWYLYIHCLLLETKWKRQYLVQMALCIFLGSLTHYYFYVYAAVLTLFMVAVLIYKRKIYGLANYCCAGVLGLMVSWICFPWFIWHIFLNQQNKHTSVPAWTLDRVKNYLLFLNGNLFHGRVYIAILVTAALGAVAAVIGKKVRGGGQKRGWAFVLLLHDGRQRGGLLADYLYA